MVPRHHQQHIGKKLKGVESFHFQIAQFLSVNLNVILQVTLNKYLTFVQQSFLLIAH